MIVAPYTKELYDPILKKQIELLRKAITEKNDAYTCLCVGATGTGKSTLMLHAYEQYIGTKGNVKKQIALNISNFAKSLKYAKESKGLRFISYDEANVSKRNSLTKENKDIIDLLFAIRGLNIFSWWNNPSAEMIDKALIKEYINGLYLITTKDVNRPRIYYFFRKRDLLRYYDKYGCLDINTLKKVRKKYSFFRGWFKDYSGVYKKEYLSMKDDRMSDKVDFFFDKYGKDTTNFVSGTEFSRRLNISYMSLKNHIETLLPFLKEEEHYIISANGRPKFCNDAIPIVEKYYREKWYKNE